MRGTLIDFLNEFEMKTEKDAIHRILVSTERQAQVNYDRNVCPLILKRDTDFSENGSIKEKQTNTVAVSGVCLVYTLCFDC